MNFHTHLNFSRKYLSLIGAVLLIFALQGSSSPVYALPSYSGAINGTVATGDIVIEGANVTLIQMGQTENKVINRTVTDIYGRYFFNELSISSDYKIQVSFGDKIHSKYYRVDAYNETDFIFNGRIEAHVRGIDESELEGSEIELYNLLGENEVNATMSYTGVAVFENIDKLDNYYVALNYKGILFSRFTGFENTSIVEPTIEVLETTTSDEDFRIAFQHVIIQRDGDVFRVREALSVENGGESVFNTSWLRGSIPGEAYDITHDTMDCCINFYQTGDFVFDPMKPLFPGDSFQLALNYLLDIRQDYVIEKSMFYDTERIFILVEKTDKTTVESISGVSLSGIESMGENEYYLLEGNNLGAGELIQFRLITEIPLVQRLSDYRGIVESFQLIIPLVMVLVFLVYQRLKDSGEDEFEEEKITDDEVLDKHTIE